MRAISLPRCARQGDDWPEAHDFQEAPNAISSNVRLADALGEDAPGSRPIYAAPQPDNPGGGRLRALGPR